MNVFGRSVAGQRHRVRATLAGLVACIGAGALLPVASADAAATYDPSADVYSMKAITENAGAPAWWNAGYTGRGVDVAVIDSGVAPVAGLDGAGKVVYGPDLSLESQAANLRNLDTFGHGTFMAGVIAGHDATLTAPYANAPASAYRGLAPDARIVSVKVATADGGTDVSQVIAAINWVIQHKTDNGMNIRVLNLSYGTNSSQAADVDPLSYAVEQAWKKGIVVVTAAGNAGFAKAKVSNGLTNPAKNPYVISVAGVDNAGTAAVTDDVMVTYSSTGRDHEKNPDLVAPGSHLQGLRVPNGYIDANHSEGRIDARYFRGSGTSQATAVTSGAVALILQKYPTLTPDQVKQYLAASAVNVPKAKPFQAGDGEIQLGAMLNKALPKFIAQKFPAATGTGTLEASRGSDHLTRDGKQLQGEVDVFGKPVDTVALATAEANGSTWSGGAWNGSTWSGSTWSGSTWSGSTWSGSTWSGSTWSGSTWSGSTWSGSTWSGSSWSGSSWSGSAWTGDTWATGSWS